MSNMYFATKGLFINIIDSSRYVVQDVFGNSTLPKTYASWNELVYSAGEAYKISPLVPVEEAQEFSSFPSFRWQELEHWYIAHLSYALDDYLIGSAKSKFYQDIYMVPVAYLEVGYGDGSRETLELIDKRFRKWIAGSEVPLDIATLEIYLVLEQFKRIFREITSLIQRSIVSFLDFLQLQRVCIQKATSSLSHLKSNEVVHRGADSYRASTAATMAVISLCTSLDIQSNLKKKQQKDAPKTKKFRPAGGQHFSDLRKLNPRRIPPSIKSDFIDKADSTISIRELVQFRHDIIHSTSAIELEKIYVGYETPEINNTPLHYSFQGWRDCCPNGQPERYLGRSYFVGKQTDIELKLFSWINDVINLHIESGARMADYLQNHKYA